MTVFWLVREKSEQNFENHWSGWKSKNPAKMNTIHGTRDPFWWPVYMATIFYTDRLCEEVEDGLLRHSCPIS